MDESGQDARPRWLEPVLGVAMALVVAGLAIFAYRKTFSTYGVQDDDGYLIVSLRGFAAGGALYDSVYSQYGPGLYTLVAGAMDLFQIPFTHDGGRFVNLAFWLASTLVAGLTLQRLTRSFPVSLAGMLLVFVVLQADANEPLHPGAAIGLVLLLTVAAAVWLYPGRPVAALAAIGGGAALLASFKVNVGVFAFAALALACVLTMPALRSRVLPLVVPVLVVALPFVLMAEHLDEPNTFRIALLVGAGVLGLILVARSGPADDRASLGGIGAAGLGALGVVVFVCAGPIINGSSPGDIVDGWFLRPSETPGLQFAPLFVDDDADLWAAFGALVAAMVAVWRYRGGTISAPARAAGAVARVVAGLAFWIVLAGPVSTLSPALTQALLVVTPFAWIAAIPPRSEGPGSRLVFVRVFIVALAVLQVMHVFPVPGSQPAWAQLLFAIVGAICLADGLDELGALARSRRPGFAHWRPLASLVAVAFGVWFCVQPLRDLTNAADANYEAGVSVDLPGAERLRLSEPQVDQLHAVTAVLDHSCSTYISLPGLNSFYLFAEQPVPTVLSGPWAFFLDTEDQQEILEQVERIPDLCVVQNPDLLEFWAGFSGGVTPERPLVRFIQEDFRTVADYGYRIGVRREAGELSP